MTADSDRHLAVFEHVWHRFAVPLYMGVAATLGIALAIAKPLSSKVTDQRAQTTGRRSILERGLAWIDSLCKEKTRHFAVHLDMAHSPSTC